MTPMKIIVICLLAIGLFLTSCFVYYRLIYPIIETSWNEQQAEQIEQSVERACSVDIQVDPDSMSELPSWQGIYPISENETLEVRCREVGRLSWECECTHKEETP